MHGFLEQVEGIDFANKVEMGIRNDQVSLECDHAHVPRERFA